MTQSMVSRRSAVLRIAGLFGMALVPRNAFGDSPKPFPHPEPRPGITAANVLSAADIGGKKSVLQAYDTARAHPEIFDGLYCVCECDKNMKHRSLLACFESEQAVGCWSCREQAELVARLLHEDESLERIRKAFDQKWG